MNQTLYETLIYSFIFTYSPQHSNKLCAAKISYLVYKLELWPSSLWWHLFNGINEEMVESHPKPALFEEPKVWCWNSPLTFWISIFPPTHLPPEAAPSGFLRGVCSGLGFFPALELQDAWQRLSPSSMGHCNCWYQSNKTLTVSRKDAVNSSESHFGCKGSRLPPPPSPPPPARGAPPRFHERGHAWKQGAETPAAFNCSQGCVLYKKRP